MDTQRKFKVFLLILILPFIFPNQVLSKSTHIPITGYIEGGNGATNLSMELALFIAQVTTGQADQITGIYAEETFAAPVIQQPEGQPAYVSDLPEFVTQFRTAINHGSLGFLAHNHLAGSQFQQLETGDPILTIFGDGSYHTYQVTQIRHFQAKSPLSPYSNFVDLEQGISLTTEELFFQTYGQPNQVVLQTCISANGIESWGRLFVIASPSFRLP